MVIHTKQVSGSSNMTSNVFASPNVKPFTPSNNEFNNMQILSPEGSTATTTDMLSDDLMNLSPVKCSFEKQF
jgi:hypothetical protein